VQQPVLAIEYWHSMLVMKQVKNWQMKPGQYIGTAMYLIMPNGSRSLSSLMHPLMNPLPEFI
jgi:hypothetical protein